MPSKKLLVADDSLTIQKVIKLALSNEGYEIQAVSEGTDAIQQIALIRPDIVLIDVSLPGRNAFEVKREINQHTDLEEVRFVLMSSAFENIDEVLLKEVNFHGQLTKPFDPAHLRQILTDVLAQVTAQRMEKTAFVSPTPTTATPTPEEPLAFSNNSFDSNAELSPTEPAFPNILAPDPATLAPGEELTMDFTQPGEMPIFPDSPPENTQNLWDQPEANSDHFKPDEDIQELTRSTLKNTDSESFSSQDDAVQWSVKEPNLPPFPKMLDTAGTTLIPHIKHVAPPPPPPLNISYSSPLASTPLTPDPVPSASISKVAAPHPISPPSTTPVEIDELVGNMVQKQIEATLQKMAEKTIPDIAEKIIKQEIHRLLTEKI